MSKLDDMLGDYYLARNELADLMTQHRRQVEELALGKAEGEARIEEARAALSRRLEDAQLDVRDRELELTATKTALERQLRRLHDLSPRIGQLAHSEVAGLQGAVQQIIEPPA